MREIALPLAAAALLTSTSLPAQEQDVSGAVFALLDKNEWCPAGSVYLDIRRGSFLLHPRRLTRECTDPRMDATVEQGRLTADKLRPLQAAFREARRAGLGRDECALVVSNGGREVLAITGAGFYAITPEEEGCWSEAAEALHRALFEVFGEQRKLTG